MKRCLLIILILIVSLTVCGCTYINTHIYDINKIHWYRYNVVVQYAIGAPSEYINESVMYDTSPFDNVSNARHMKEIDVASNETQILDTITVNLYYDPSDNYRLLGGNMNYSLGYRTIDVNNPLYFDPVIKLLNISISNLNSSGTETTVVPAGTYVCTKYTIPDNWTWSSTTYYYNKSLPLPVKIYDINNVASTTVISTYELVGYG